MVPEQNGLSPLQMGVAGHNDPQVLLRLIHNRLQQLLDQVADLINFRAQVHPQIQGHLVIPGPGGVELLAHIPQPLGQHLLHKHMDILAGVVKVQFSRFQVVQDSLQSLDQGIRLLLGQDALGPQHGGVGHGAGDILLIQFAVKVDGGIEIIRNAADLAGRPSGPHFCHSPLPRIRNRMIFKK